MVFSDVLEEGVCWEDNESLGENKGVGWLVAGTPPGGGGGGGGGGGCVHGPETFWLDQGTGGLLKPIYKLSSINLNY